MEGDMMKTARKIFIPVATLLLLMAITVPVQGESEFLFYGFSKYWEGEPPDAVGSNMEVFGILSSVGGLDFPIALDTDNYEYTLFIATMTVATFSNDPDYILILTYDNAEIHIFADPIVGGTAADYADYTTFMDGELILNAIVDNGLTVNLFDFPPNQDGNFAGFASGACDFIGGTQLDALIAAESLLENWGVYGTVADPDSGPGIEVPDGFHRLFDVKITPPNDPSSSESSTWGGVKSLFR